MTSDPFGFAAAINWDVVDEHADEITAIFDRQTDFAVVDEESATKVGDQYTVLGRFDTEAEAVAFIGKQDSDKVARGGFGIDGPTEDW